MIDSMNLKTLKGVTILAAVVVVGVLIGSPTVRADDQEDNRSQEEKQMIQIGLRVAPVPLNMKGKDQDAVGLGSFIVNVVSDCNGCHTNDPSTRYLPAGNPYLLMPPKGPFLGTQHEDRKTYLVGGSDFGVFPSPGGSVHIISRNLTPDKSGMPEGGRTLNEFIHTMRTGEDLDKAHPNCTATITKNCLLPPFDGSKLQVMPWTAFRNMTDHQLIAIYTYLSTIPCLEGGPGEPANRCGK